MRTKFQFGSEFPLYNVMLLAEEPTQAKPDSALAVGMLPLASVFTNQESPLRAHSKSERHRYRRIPSQCTHVVSVQDTLVGDINGDGVVNILDAVLLANSFLATPSSSNWNPNADLNGDGAVNILDAIMLVDHFQEHYP